MVQELDFSGRKATRWQEILASLSCKSSSGRLESHLKSKKMVYLSIIFSVMYHVFTEAQQEILAKIASSNCEPIYLSPYRSGDGHSAATANATITYIQYGGRLYGVTCAHVISSQHDTDEKFARILTVRGENTIHQFGAETSGGYESQFKCLASSGSFGCGIDIAIVKLPSSFLEGHLRRKGKVPVDFDSWEEPLWKDIKTLWVCGFPTEHKSQTITRVLANPSQIVAELSGAFDVSRIDFLIASSMSDNACFLSGISGGAVYSVQSNMTLALLGIVFEGSPGGSAEWLGRGADAFSSMNDVRLKAYLLTPSVLERWINEVGY